MAEIVHVDDLERPALHAGGRGDPRLHGDDGRRTARSTPTPCTPRRPGRDRARRLRRRGLPRAARRAARGAAGRSTGSHDPGVVSFHMQVLQLLKNRLLLTDLLARHPEIHDIELVPPVVIAGLPRTGTTHLHNLLAAGPTFRVLRYWESLEPFPLAAEVGVEPDPRLARTDLAVDFMGAAMPHFALMHEMTTQHVHEEIQLLANDFSSMLMETHRARARLARPLPRPRPDAALRAPAHPAAGAAVPARRPAVAAEVAAAPRAAAGARAGLPRPHRRRHPPRPGAGDALDGDDALLHGPDAPLAGRRAEIADYWVDRLGGCSTRSCATAT